MPAKLTPAEHIALVAAGGALGTASGLIAQGSGSLPGIAPGSAGLRPAYTFASATAHALKNHSTLRAALGAGATAVVGGPAVVAAAPVILAVGGVALGAAAIFGVYKWLTDED